MSVDSIEHQMILQTQKRGAYTRAVILEDLGIKVNSIEMTSVDGYEEPGQGLVM